MGCRCFSAATGGSPGMAAGLGCCPGELCARPWGIPGGRHCPWGLACAAGPGAPLALQSWGRRAAAALPGADALGCPCSPLLCLWGPHQSTGQSSPPRVSHCRTAQLQPRGAPAGSRGMVPACSQGTRAASTPSQATGAGEVAQQWHRCHSSGAGLVCSRA